MADDAQSVQVTPAEVTLAGPSRAVSRGIARLRSSSVVAASLSFIIEDAVSGKRVRVKAAPEVLSEDLVAAVASQLAIARHFMLMGASLRAVLAPNQGPIGSAIRDGDVIKVVQLESVAPHGQPRDVGAKILRLIRDENLRSSPLSGATIERRLKASEDWNSVRIGLVFPRMGWCLVETDVRGAGPGIFSDDIVPLWGWLPTAALELRDWTMPMSFGPRIEIDFSPT